MSYINIEVNGKIIKARVQQKSATYDEWMANEMPILNGEQAFIKDSSGRIVNYRLGDGTRKFSELPDIIQYDQAAYIAYTDTPTQPVAYTIVGQGTYGSITVGIDKLAVLGWTGSSWLKNVEINLPKIEVVDGFSSTDKTKSGSADNDRLLNIGVELAKVSKYKDLKNIVEVSNWQDLINISQNKEMFVGYLIKLKANIYINNTSALLGVNTITLPLNSIIQFNSYSIRSANIEFFIQSPINFGDDGDNFESYPILDYDRKIVPRPIYYTFNEDWRDTILKGMFRCVDDKVYITDFHRGKRFNKAFSNWVNSEIIFAEDYILSYGDSDADDTYYYGINSNCTLKCENNAIIKFLDVTTNENNNRCRIVGNNVSLTYLNIGENGGPDRHIAFTWRPARNYGIVKLTVDNCKMRAVINTTVNPLFLNNEFLPTISRTKMWCRDSIENVSLLNTGTLLNLRYCNGGSIRNNNFLNAFYAVNLNNSVGVDILNNNISNIKMVGVLINGGLRLTEKEYSPHRLAFENQSHYIARNNFTNVGEESISIDTVNARLNMFTVNSVITNSITFNSYTVNAKNEVSGDFGILDSDVLYYKNGCFLISLHKDRAMKYHKIEGIRFDSTLNKYVIKCDYDSFNSAQVGDKYIVAKVGFNNLAENNVIKESWTSLCIYGNAIGNIFRNNVTFSTGVASSTWMMYMMAHKNVTGGLSRSYYNPIIDNTYENNKIIDEYSVVHGAYNGLSCTVKTYEESSTAIPTDPNITLYPNKGNKFILNNVKGVLTVKDSIGFTSVNNRAGSYDYINCIDIIESNPLPKNIV